MKRKLLLSLATSALVTGAAFAGSFTNDFSNPQNLTGFTLNQLADNSGNAYPILTNNELQLLYNEVSLGPISIVLDDLDGGASIDSFTANFQLQLGPGTSTPADGVAFAFGPDITSVTTFGETGPFMGSGGVNVEISTYDHGDAVHVGFGVQVAGTLVATFPMSAATLVDGAMHPVTIQLNRNGTLNVTWAGQAIFTNLNLPGWFPINGQFGIGGRNGGLSEFVAIQDLGVTTTVLPATPAPPSITSQPQNVSIGEGNSATFTIGYDGDAPLSLQWLLNGAAITGATNPVLTLLDVPFSDNNAKISCTVSNASGQVALSTAATLSVIADTTPPTVAKVATDLTFTNVMVTYSEPVSDSALLKSNYSIDQGVTIGSISRVDAQTVELATSRLAESAVYNLTINGVQDTATTPNTIAANTKIQFRSFVFLNGAVLHKKYNNCLDNYSLANFFADPRYPNNPDRQDIETSWEYPANAVGRVAADPVRNYCDTIEGYFVPPVSTNYVFFTCGDDEYYLYLSTDDSPVNLHQICSEPGGWTDNRAWTTLHSGDLTAMRSDQYVGTEWPNTDPGTGLAVISLTAGQRYYMLSMHHDHSWSGGDYHGVTYKVDGTPDPAVGSAPLLTSGTIAFYFDPTGASLDFNQQPQNVVSVAGTTAMLSVAATGTSVYGTNVAYQWQLAPSGSTTWTNITGATAQSFTTPILALADSGTQLRAIATMAPLTATSQVATVSVIADTNAPSITAGAMADPATAGTVDIGVGFNKTVDPASVSLQANYSVSSGTITGIQVYTNRFTSDSQNPLAEILRQSVLLKVTGFAGSGTVTVKNLADTHGNTIASETANVSVSTNMSWGVVGANSLGGANAVVPVAPNGFDVYSDGVAEWAAYDETTFVFEPVTGNFDKKLRVEYQDGSSEWARAGLVVRDGTNVFGMDQTTQTGSAATAPPYDGMAGRYQKCHVNPVGPCLTGPGTGGNGMWEGNRRLDTGSATTTALTGPDSTPLYPQAWCRISRTNQTFTIYRSDDGANWVTLGQTTWGVDDQTHTPMPNTVYVGPEFSPENGNITVADDKGTFLASFRDYGDVVSVSNTQLKIGMDATGKVSITWSGGTLLSSPSVQGPFGPVQGATTSPFLVTPSTGTTFYRVKQ